MFCILCQQVKKKWNLHIAQKAGNTRFQLLKCKFSRKLKVFVTNGGFLEKNSLFSIKTTFAFLEKTKIPDMGTP